MSMTAGGAVFVPSSVNVLVQPATLPATNSAGGVGGLAFAGAGAGAGILLVLALVLIVLHRRRTKSADKGDQVVSRSIVLIFCDIVIRMSRLPIDMVCVCVCVCVCVSRCVCVCVCVCV